MIFFPIPVVRCLKKLRFEKPAFGKRIIPSGRAGSRVVYGGQMALLVRIHELVQNHSQWRIATHSPILTTYWYFCDAGVYGDGTVKEIICAYMFSDAGMVCSTGEARARLAEGIYGFVRLLPG